MARPRELERKRAIAGPNRVREGEEVLQMIQVDQ